MVRCPPRVRGGSRGPCWRRAARCRRAGADTAGPAVARHGPARSTRPGKATRRNRDAAQILGDRGPLLLARVRLDLLPKDARQLAVAEFEERTKTALDKALKTTTDKPGPKALTTAIFQELPRRFAQVVNEGKELVFD